MGRPRSRPGWTRPENSSSKTGKLLEAAARPAFLRPVGCKSGRALGNLSPMSTETVRTEDGAELREGDAAYNYYDRKPGRIGRLELGPDAWFTFRHEDGTSAYLDGSRICTVAYARSRGWLA